MNVGDIFVETYSGCMSVLSAYQVIDISKTGKTCTVKKIRLKDTYTSQKVGESVPVRDDFVNSETKKCKVMDDRICVGVERYTRKHVEDTVYNFDYRSL